MTPHSFSGSVCVTRCCVMPAPILSPGSGGSGGDPAPQTPGTTLSGSEAEADLPVFAEMFCH